MLTLSIDRGYTSPFSRQELDSFTATVKVVIYARVSTQDQARHGYSLTSQVERCVQMAKQRYGIEEDEMIAFVEQGEMGDDPSRPALNEALRFIEQGIGRVLVVLHPDRLARDLKLQLYITERIWNAGCEIAFVEMDVDPNNPESLLLYNIQGAIAQYNKAKILANSRRGRKAKVMNGKIPGIRRVYGYVFDKERDTLVEEPLEKETYLQMVEWMLHGKDGHDMNFTLIAKELSLLGIPAPMGNHWYQATVSRILKSPVYTGKFYYGKTEYKQKAGQTEIVKKPQSEWQMVRVPAYITDETFEQLQRRIQSLTRRNRGAKPHTTYLLKGLARCGRCGAAVVAGPPSRNKETGEILYHYYVCSAKTRKVFEVGSGKQVHRCTGRNWRKDVIDDCVWRVVVAVMVHSSDSIDTIVSERDNSQRVGKLISRRDRILKALEEKRRERARWLQLRVKDRITELELDDAMGALDRDIRTLQTAVSSIDVELTAHERNVDEGGGRPRTTRLLRYLVNGIGDEDKKALVDKVVRQVVVGEDEIRIQLAVDDSNNFFFGQGHGGL
ncbi:recombinase family protein [Alicyclobacillus dauci]|uniref:Recombinase family protein n=1 Tax=Alicyclobacillus dauci TaxID=1475485 RepID=A0ABY6YYW3_9BACL|nr:recombinase family protein [Alicyclobacillus dauci]WAH35316.1 recombinase family protein [Alicyclobacillus dauci]